MSKNQGAMCDRSRGVLKILVFMGLFMLGGCATPIMKATPFYEGKASAYTAPIEDRVNLWPLVYSREPALSVLWPMFSFSDEHLALRPFYSQYRQGGATGEYDEFSLLWPYCQIDTRAGKGWCLPCYWTRDKTHILPIYSLLERKNQHELYVWPLLSSASWSDVTEAYSWRLCLGLAAAETDSRGIGRSWFFPFYYHRDNAEFQTLIYGWSDNGKTRTTDWCTPLVRTWSGSKTGFRLWPFAEHSFEGDADRLEQDIEKQQMPQTLHYQTLTVTNKAQQIEHVKRFVPQTLAKQQGCVFGVFQWSESVFDNMKGSDYLLQKSTRGHCPLTFSSRERRDEIFNCATREKRGERIESSCNLLGFVYNSERHLDTDKKVDRSRQRILHWLWNREEENGNVSIDMLPGYTYDSKTNGFYKTSFLWRFFRYEETPGQNPKVDFLYVPIWR